MISLVLAIGLAAQLPVVKPFPAPSIQTTTQPAQDAWKASGREFEKLLAGYCKVQNDYSLLFNEMMQHRGEIWNVEKARKLVELRTEADRLWNKLITSPMYRVR